MADAYTATCPACVAEVMSCNACGDTVQLPAGQRWQSLCRRNCCWSGTPSCTGVPVLRVRSGPWTCSACGGRIAECGACGQPESRWSLAGIGQAGRCPGCGEPELAGWIKVRYEDEDEVDLWVSVCGRYCVRAVEGGFWAPMLATSGPRRPCLSAGGMPRESANPMSLSEAQRACARHAAWMEERDGR